MKSLKKIVIGLFSCLFSIVTVFADDSTEIEISKYDNSIIVNNIEKNTIGIQVEIPVVSGDISGIDFVSINSDYNGFVVTENNKIIIYIANDVDLRNDTTIELGELSSLNGIEFYSEGRIVTTDFLYNENVIENVVITVVGEDNDSNHNNNNNNNNNDNDNNDTDNNTEDNDNEDSNDNDNTENNSNSNSGSSSSGSSSNNWGSSSDLDNTEDELDEEDILDEDYVSDEDDLEENQENSDTLLDTLLDTSLNTLDEETKLEIIEKYSDISSHWAKDYIASVIHQGLFAGTSEDEFSPNTNMNRAMFVTVLSRMENIEEVETKTIFTDVPNDTWYSSAVNWAYANNITNGTTANTFSPTNNITREQMAVLLYNYINKFNIEVEFVEEKNAFADESSMSNYAKDAVYFMQQGKILNGKNDNNFDPQGLATRAEVATMMSRFLDMIN